MGHQEFANDVFRTVSQVHHLLHNFRLAAEVSDVGANGMERYLFSLDPIAMRLAQDNEPDSGMAVFMLRIIAAFIPDNRRG